MKRPTRASIAEAFGYIEILHFAKGLALPRIAIQAMILNECGAGFHALDISLNN
ncbi:hypothetical protein CPter291_3854 [Collimonas pratensis]|uniref:Uncharacterized protein n=1 Tax=Collimonas pratensis TaxID=279113 RepID=A0ABM5ZA54_9BURK|nr:hypothetical protein CPter291_3854 [Collimonas pratensis]